MKKKTIIIIAVVIAVLVVAFFIFKPKKTDAEKINIETAKVGTGSVSKSVTATGTLEAITTVEVGTQVSGIVEKIYVDFNSYVKKGQLLARIDTTNLAAAVEQSQASLDNAKAVLDYQQANFDRLNPLKNKNLISQAEYDEKVYNLNTAKASYKNALAQHKKNKINLAYAMIYSPINGIVLNKAVEEGQTVAASFSTPTLFSIANDLTQMRVEANVDEADIGRVKQGQRVEFTVDAYPDLTFNGEVTEVRLEPTVTNNVVTYTIIISAPNPDFKLMPGMTAETEIYVLERRDVLIVPSRALRFKPDQQLLSKYMKSLSLPENNNFKPEMAKGKRGDFPPQRMAGGEKKMGNMIWVIENSIIHPVRVETGMNDDINVEIISGLKSGDEVVLVMEEEGKPSMPNNAGGNPFMPGPPRRR